MGGILEDNFLMETYSIKIINHIKVSSFLWQTTLLIFLVGYFLKFDLDTFVVVFAFSGIFTVPAIYLHIEYLIKNNGCSIELESDKLTFTRGSESVDYKFVDMDKVILYKSASLDKGGIPLSPIEAYHYARVITKSNEELIITCLIAPKVDVLIKHLTGVKFARKKRLFCTVFWK